MKNLRIPILFAAASVVFSFVSLMSCQNEDSSSEEAKADQIEIIQEEEVSQDQSDTETVEVVYTSKNMRFGPR